MKMLRFVSRLPGILFALLLATPALAHPHLLIGQTVRFIVKDGQFTHVEVEWAFDPFSSDLEIAAADDDKDGKLSPREVAELAKIALPELKRFGYLTWINSGGKDERPAIAPTFAARIANPAIFVPGAWAPVQDSPSAAPAPGAPPAKIGGKGEPPMRNLVYVLRYPLARPSKTVSLAAIDPDDYIRIEASETRPFVVEGDGGRASCRKDKHPEIKSEFVRARPFFADRVTCILP